MRIALCYSGQPRTWANCAPGHFKLIEKLNKKFNAKTDIFTHAWDFNTSPHAVLKSGINKTVAEDYLTVKGTLLEDSEKENFLSVFQPKGYIFENEDVSKSRIKQVREWGEKHKDWHGGSAIEWAASQLYGIMHSAHLKKKYEYENNIKYDMCFRMRYDLFFDDHQIDWFLSKENTDIKIPKYNTLYSCHTSISDNQYPFRRAGDIFWYSDSVTFDRICDVYRWLPVIGKKPFGPDADLSPEHVLYYYAKMIDMNVYPLTVDPKIYRQSDYLIKKIQAGQPAELGGHELI